MHSLCFFSHSIPPCSSITILKNRRSNESRAYRTAALPMYIFAKHSHQQWFTVKEFGICSYNNSNDDDDDDDVCGREVKFMFDNAFLQSHCLWMVTNRNATSMHTCIRTHSYPLPRRICMYVCLVPFLLLVGRSVSRWYAICVHQATP